MVVVVVVFVFFSCKKGNNYELSYVLRRFHMLTLLARFPFFSHSLVLLLSFVSFEKEFNSVFIANSRAHSQLKREKWRKGEGKASETKRK